MVTELAIGAAILAAMLCVSWYGWVTLPADARVPIHFGPAAYNNFVSKRAGLIVHPAAGGFMFIILVAVSEGTGRKAVASLIILPVVMAVLLGTQAGAIWVARRRAGG